MMEKVAPQQLSLPFDSPQEVLSASFSATVIYQAAVQCQQFDSDIPLIPATPLTVLDFQHAFAKRESQKSSVLYRKILDSVRHIS